MTRNETIAAVKRKIQQQKDLAEGRAPSSEEKLKKEKSIEENPSQSSSSTLLPQQTVSGLPRENREKFVVLSSSGILNHYAPTFRNIKKDLERLNIRQEVLTVDISTESAKLKEANAHVSLEEMISVTNYYRDKLIGLKSSMLQLSDRTGKLRERACVLQEQKQAEALVREAKRAQHLAREQQLIAKNDS
eukprot:TRINITY_DN12065_c0_g1_i1.p1 TRINITY_DN12065_c0_g1~~TRINITY_DN12065_c0_g1_i1.p1  ORF type:complete len:190 (+),score=48.16 TRINITY_DN12065_c0_g1_i1:33-602(+)